MKVIWMTGISGAGKSTIAKHLQENFFMNSSPFRAVIIDGDELRQGISRNVSLDDHGRLENVKNAAYMASMLLKQKFHVIVALMSPLEEHRQEAIKIIGKENFVLVHVRAPLELVKKRDPKRLYERFDRGLIKGMYGCDLKYEVPVDCITIDTATCTPDEAASHIYCWAIVAKISKALLSKKIENN